MFVAFIGIQIPLITLLLSTTTIAKTISQPVCYQILGFIGINAIATALTLDSLYKLLSPILITSDVLNKYLNDETDSPSDFSSEITSLITDADDALTRLNGVIQHLTNYDTITGLPNRELFQQRVQQAIESTGKNQFAIIVLDLDNLQDINSTLGREVGDLLLQAVSQRLGNLLDSSDIFARFGGNDFAVLRTNIIDRENSLCLSRLLLDSFIEPFFVNGGYISCSAKIGITIYPLDGITAPQLLQNADTAIYQAKQQNLNTYQFYSPAMSDRLKRALAIKENLRHALARNELYIYYQPRMEIATGKVAGVEALLRWHSSELGLVSPAEFIPIAEATKMIIPIGEWVLHNACIQSKKWQQLGMPPLKIAVNISTCQFKENLIETIDLILEDTSLDCSYLELEITESLLVENIDKAIALLKQLKHRGISIALDDFGTSYSSLRYLQNLPIDTLKIDRSFVTNITERPENAAISRAIVALAQNLSLKITAEGVETKEQLVYLKERGCHEVQGYYFSKPLPSKMLEVFLSDRLCK